MWNISDAFAAELRKGYTTACKLEILNDDFDPIEDYTIDNSPVAQKTLTNFLSDGNVDVDTERGTRRTGEVTIINPTAEFTPALKGFKSDSPWAGVVYVNRVIRLHRGLYLGDTPATVPIGTFLIDNAQVMVERNMSLVVLTLSDLWKKMTKSLASKPQNYPIGTSYNIIISELVEQSGADFPLAPVLDQLNTRATEDKQIDAKIVIEEGDSRGERLKELVTAWDIDAYFDPKGRFITEDRKNPRDKEVVWHFYSSPDRDGMLVNVTRSFTDDNLYNHVVVIGGTVQNPIRREQVDEDPNSKFNVETIGDRVIFIKDDKLTTENKVLRRLDEEWKMRTKISETTECEIICHPALEGDDVIRLTEENFARVDQTYRLKRFNVPLVTSRQKIQVVDVVDEGALYQ